MSTGIDLNVVAVRAAFWNGNISPYLHWFRRMNAAHVTVRVTMGKLPFGGGKLLE